MPARGVKSKQFQEKAKVTIYLPSWMVTRLRHTCYNQSKFFEELLSNTLMWKKGDKYTPIGDIEE